MRKIVLLFLAHQGLSKEAVEFWANWNNWKGRSLILFYNIGPKVEGKYSSLWNHVGNPPTKYCDASLVLVVQDGIKKILQDDLKKEVYGMYLLSAVDFPLVTAEELYKLQDLNRFCSLHRTQTKEEKKILPPNSFPHSQWFSLNREGMEAFAKNSFEKAKEYHRLLGKWTSYTKQLKHLEDILADIKSGYLEVVSILGPMHPNSQGWKFALLEVQRRLDRLEAEQRQASEDVYLLTEECPDEYWSLLPILEAKLRVSAYCPTAYYQPALYLPDMKKTVSGQVGSPITWDQKNRYFLQLHRGTVSSYNFSELVDYVKKQKAISADPFLQNSFMFLRKVQPSLFGNLKRSPHIS